jgi:type IV pilus assembly protein PilV
MVEVLVSILIVGFGLLGAMGLLLTALRSTAESGNFATAVNLAREFSERARVNRRVALLTTNPYLMDVFERSAGSAGLPATSPVNCLSTSCTPANLASWDASEWAVRVQDSLPDARIKVCNDSPPTGTTVYRWACTNSGPMVVKLGWASKAPKEGLDEAVAANRLPRVVVVAEPGI